MRGHGLLDRDNPHTSFTQLAAFDECPQGWFERYSRPRRKLAAKNVADGAVMDDLFKEITLDAKAKAAQGYGLEDVDPILERYAGQFTSVGMYRRICEGARRYAERMEQSSVYDKGGSRHAGGRPSRLNIVASPFEFKTHVTVDGLKVALWGELDRLDVNEQGEPEFHEFKLYGKLVGWEDLEEDLQLGIYNFAYRRMKRYYGPAWKVWHSGLRGVKLVAKADTEEAQAVERHIVATVRSMFRSLRSGKFERRVNRNCEECRGARRCEKWTAEWRGRATGDPIPATLKAYDDLRGRAAALDKAKERVRELLKVRVEGNGGVLDEEGFHGELKVDPPNLDERYLGMTRDELLEELRTGGRTTLIVKRLPPKGRK